MPGALLVASFFMPGALLVASLFMRGALLVASFFMLGALLVALLFMLGALLGAPFSFQRASAARLLLIDRCSDKSLWWALVSNSSWIIAS